MFYLWSDRLHWRTTCGWGRRHFAMKNCCRDRINQAFRAYAVWLMIPRAFSPETWSNAWSIVTCHGCLLAQIMPPWNLLSFLRPLYDIAVWQFILMLGFKVERWRIARLKFTWKMHQVVANFVCKLLEARPFDHLKARMEEAGVKTGNRGMETRGQTDKENDRVVPRSMVEKRSSTP